MGLCSSKENVAVEQRAMQPSPQPGHASEMSGASSPKHTTQEKRRTFLDSVGSAITGRSTRRGSKRYVPKRPAFANEEDSQKCTIVSGIRFFEGVSMDAMTKLAPAFERASFGAGEALHTEGEASDVFSIIVSGTVAVTAKNNTLDLNTLKQGDWLGEHSLVSDGSSAVPYSAKAIDAVEILRITQEAFKPILDSPHFYDKRVDAAIPSGSQGGSTQASSKQRLLDMTNEGQLMRFPFFRLLDPSLVRLLACMCNQVEATRKNNVVQEGQSCDGFYMLVTGALEMASSKSVLDNFGSFGESSLTSSNSKWLSTYKALQDSHLAFLPAKRAMQVVEMLDGNLREDFMRNVRTRAPSSFKIVPIFSVFKRGDSWDDKILDLFSALFEHIVFEDGQEVYRQGAVADAFYIIVNGKVQISSEGSDGANQVDIDILESKEWFGENALYFDAALKKSKNADAYEYYTSAKALGTISCLRVLRSNIARFREVCPDIYSSLERRLSMKSARKLESIPFFQGIRENRPWSKIGLLGSLFKFIDLESGVKVIEEGDMENAKFYVIVHGKCDVTVMDDDGSSSLHLETLSDGQWFGEMSLMLNTPKSATVSTSEPTLLMYLTSDRFKKFLNIAPELADPFEAMLRHRTSNTLKKFDFFKKVRENKPWSKLELLASLMSYEMYDKGTPIFRAGDPGNAFYIIARGEVDVFVPQHPADESMPFGQNIDHLEEGSYFGEMSLIDAAPRTATIVPTQQLVMLKISSASFKKFLNVAPELKKPIQDLIQKRRETLESVDAGAPDSTSTKDDAVSDPVTESSSQHEAEPVASPDPTSEPVPEPAAAAAPEPAAGPEAAPEPTPEIVAAPEPAADPEAAPEPTPKPEAAPEPESAIEPTTVPEPAAKAARVEPTKDAVEQLEPANAAEV